MELKTINFKPIQSDIVIPDDATKKYDLRNGIVCISPTMDLECYYNYIQFLNLYQSDWKSLGYLDMGMIPLVMLPSFFPEELKEILSTAATSQGIKVYAMPPVSNLKGAYRGTVSDVWVYREDLAKVLNVRYQEATLSRWLREIMKFSK